jgi:D-lactate dehydrogenase
LVHVPAYSPYAVAEYTLAMILTLNRKTHRAYNRTKDLNFNINGFVGFDLKGKTAGIIGTGQIGRIVASILNGFGVKLLLSDPYPDSEFAETINAEYTDLASLCRNADIISLNCPLTPATYHLINDDAVKLMKNGVMLINTGRGPLIDTDALIKGLKSRKIGSAGLDVYEEESDYFFEDFSNDIIDDDRLGRLLTFNNVLITSHQAFFTEEALGNIAATTLQNINDYFTDRKLDNEICYHVCSKGCNKEKNGRCW